MCILFFKTTPLHPPPPRTHGNVVCIMHSILNATDIRRQVAQRLHTTLSKPSSLFLFFQVFILLFYRKISFKLINYVIITVVGISLEMKISGFYSAE